jgi:putative flippase GtrA
MVARYWEQHAGFRFLVVGGVCAVLYFLICLGLREYAGLSAFFSSFWAYVICFWIGYGSQRGLTFRSSVKHSIAIRRYFILHATGAIVVSALTSIATDVSSLAPVYTSLVSTTLCGIASFFISSRWVFREH